MTACVPLMRIKITVLVNIGPEMLLSSISRYFAISINWDSSCCLIYKVKSLYMVFIPFNLIVGSLQSFKKMSSNSIGCELFYLLFKWLKTYKETIFIDLMTSDWTLDTRYRAAFSWFNGHNNVLIILRPDAQNTMYIIVCTNRSNTSSWSLAGLYLFKLPRPSQIRKLMAFRKTFLVTSLCTF